MCYIPDPIELMDMQMDRQIDLIDRDGTYPCVVCKRRFKVEDMFPISAHPAASLECRKEDCNAKEETPKVS